MEFRGEAVARGVTPLATLLSGGTASEAQWPFTGAKDSSTLVGLMSDILEKAGVQKDQIGLVAVSGSGVPHIDLVEKDAVTTFFAATQDLPPIICTTTAWGNLMEAGGIAEIGAMACYYKSGQIPSQVMLQIGKSCEFNPNKKTVGLVLRTSLSGEYTGLVVRF